MTAADRCGRLIQVGHLERFNPAVTAVRRLLTRPMFFEAHRLSVFTPRSLDVDVVLDLMIHDLDIVLSLVSSAVREVRAVGLPVLSRTVDIANVRLEFENGCVANFTASRISTERVRKLRFFQPHQYLSLDFARQDLLLIDVTAAAGLTNAELAAMVERHSKPGAEAHPTAGLSLSKVPVEAGEPLRLELPELCGGGAGAPRSVSRCSGRTRGTWFGARDQRGNHRACAAYGIVMLPMAGEVYRPAKAGSAWVVSWKWNSVPRGICGPPSILLRKPPRPRFSPAGSPPTLSRRLCTAVVRSV